MSVLWYLVPPGYCETDVLDMYRALMMCVTMGGGSFALCLFPLGQAYVTKMKGISKESVPPALLPLPVAAPAALVCVAFAAAAQQLSSVLLLRALIVVGISFVFIAELSAEFLVYYCVHNLDGNMVLVVFVFMMHGQGKAQFGLYPSCTRRHAHRVGLRHARSFQQFGLRVLRESPVKLFSGLFNTCSSGMMTDGVITDTVSGTVVDLSGMVLDGIFADTVFGTVVLDGIFADTVPGTVVRPSGMVLDGIFADPFADQGSAAACGCSSTAAASKRSSCSGSKVSNTALGEMKE